MLDLDLVCRECGNRMGTIVLGEGGLLWIHNEPEDGGRPLVRADGTAVEALALVGSFESGLDLSTGPLVARCSVHGERVVPTADLVGAIQRGGEHRNAISI